MNDNHSVTLPAWLLVSHAGTSVSQVEAWYIILTRPDKTIEEYQQLTGLSLDNVERLLFQVQLWHDNCNNIVSNNIGVGVINRDNNSSLNTTTTTPNNALESCNQRTIMLSRGELPVDSSCSTDLYHYCIKSERALSLIEYWYNAYLDSGRPELDVLAPQTLAVALKISREEQTDKAVTVINWLFTSDHYRAKWLRKQGQVFLHNVCNSKTIIANHQFATQPAAIEQPKQKPARRPRATDIG